MKRIVQFICVGSLLVFLFPLHVMAEGSTYWVTPLTVDEGTVAPGSIYYQNYGTAESRSVILYSGNLYQIYTVSKVSGLTTKWRHNNSLASVNIGTSVVVDGVTYYVGSPGNGGMQGALASLLATQYNYPTVSVTRNSSNAIYYTYGAGAVGPEEPIDWGDLVDVKFSTEIAGSGSAATNNIDVITWDPVQDSNGNALSSDERVEIKAIAGNYTASSRNGLFGLGATDFDYNSGREHVLGEFAANRGEFHVAWSEVIQQLNEGSISDFLNIRKSDDVWLKSGWIYQYRFVADGYTGTWHTIYNGTSAGVQNSINIEQSTQINTNLVNTIVEINTLNNSEQQNWMISNTVINMENSDGQETTDKPWWAYLLEAIVSLIDGVLSFLGNLIGDLINAIIDLFTFDSFDLDVIVDFGTEQRESNNIIGQSVNFFDNVVQSAQSMRESDVIISYPGITLFDVELLPAADYNLNDYVDDLGLTDFHNLAYLVTDGSIAICLISLVYRKIMGILRS